MSKPSIDRFVRGELAPEEESVVLAQLKICPCCQSHFETLCEVAQRDSDPFRPHVLSEAEMDTDSDFLQSLFEIPVPTDDELKRQIILPGTDEASHPLGVLGKYWAIQSLGRGGFGEVFKAQDSVVGGYVALKVLYPWTYLEDESRQRLLEEARHHRRVNHPNVVKVLGADQDGMFAYLVMELVEGKSLKEYLPNWKKLREKSAAEHNRSLTLFFSRIAAIARPWRIASRRTRALTFLFKRIAELMLEVADGLATLHSAGVIHLDVTPANILTEREKRKDRTGKRVLHAKLTDFGLAVGAGTGPTGILFGGAPGYMSPEQAKYPLTSSEIDCRSDIFSAGVVLYELLTGTNPFVADQEKHSREVADELTKTSIRFGTLQPPRTLNKACHCIPRDLEAIALKCLEKNPDNRYQTAKELREDLRRWLGNEPVLANPPALSRRAWLWVLRNKVRTGFYAAFMIVTTLVSIWGWHIRTKNSEIENKNVELRNANIELSAANAAELQARKRADANARQSRAAMNEYQPAISELAWASSTQQLCRELLQTVLRFHGEFIAINGDDPEHRMEVADSQFRLAYALAVLGKMDEAKIPFHESERYFAKLRDRGPIEDEILVLVAYLNDRVQVAKLMGLRLADEEAGLQDAMRYSRELCNVANRPVDAEDRLAGSLVNYGGWLLAAERPENSRLELGERARSMLAEVVELLEAISPTNELQRYTLAAAQSNLVIAEAMIAASEAANGQPQNGNIDERFHESIEAWRKLLQSKPNAPPYLEELAKAEHALGYWQEKTGRLPEAQASYKSAQATMQSLVDLNLPAVEYRWLLATISSNLSKILRQPTAAMDKQAAYEAAGKVIEALEALPTHELPMQRGLTMLVDAYQFRTSHFSDNPTSDLVHNARAAHEVERLMELNPIPEMEPIRKLLSALWKVKSGQLHMESIAVKSLLDTMQNDGGFRFDLACVFSRCAEAASGDKSLDDAERQRLMDESANQALKLLGEPATVKWMQMMAVEKQTFPLVKDPGDDLQWLRENRRDELELIRQQVQELQR